MRSSIKYLLLLAVLLFVIVICVNCGKTSNKSRTINATKPRSSSSTSSSSTKLVVKPTKVSKPLVRNQVIKPKVNKSLIRNQVKVDSAKVAKSKSKTGKLQVKSKQTRNKSKVSKRNLNDMIKSLPSDVVPIIHFTNGLTDKQQEKALEIIGDVLERANTSTELAQCVRMELEKELDMKNNVIVTSKQFMSASLTKIPGTVMMDLGYENKKTKDQIVVSVFGAQGSGGFDRRASLLMERAKKLSPKIVDALMSDDMKQEVVRMAARVVKNANNMVAVSDQMSEVLGEKFGPHWHTVVANKNTLAIDDHRKTSVFYLNMDFGDMRVSVFK